MLERHVKLHSPLLERLRRRLHHLSSHEAKVKEGTLAERIASYLPSAEILKMKPSAVDRQRREEYRKTRPGDDFALILHEGKLAIVPSWHPINQTPKSANSAVYGTGSMETLSFEPVVDANNRIVSANIVLLDPRMDRLYDRALPAREIDFPIDRKTYAQGITDLMAILGKNVLERDGKRGIGSIRVQVGPGMGKFGKSAIGAQIDSTVESYFGSKSFPERAYTGEGLVLSAGPDQRFQPFRGKHSSHYGEGGRIGAIAKRLGADDAILFAPYDAKNPSQVDILTKYKNDPKGLDEAMLHLAISDGLGAELMAVRKDGTILLPPMNVNRLGGVTAEYVMKHLAPSLGMKVKEEPFSLQQVLDGEIVGLFFAGNAARISSVGKIKLHDANEKVLREINLEIPQEERQLTKHFEDQVTGKEKAAHPSLVTSIDLQDGENARKLLEKAYAGWI